MENEMGRLITKDSMDMDPTFYFEDTCWVNGKWMYKWPNPSFPYQLAIHSDDMEENKIRIEIRKWIENNLQDIVIFHSIDKSYRVFFNSKYEIIGRDRHADGVDWDKGRDISNIWCIFYFEDEHSATMFKLKFSDIIQKITEKHPNSEI